MKTKITLAMAALALLLVAGCTPREKSGRGFVLPVGDEARGKAVFVELKCTECHRVENVAGLPAPTEPANQVVLLGGEVTALRSYGDLVTSIIHPSDKISENLRPALSGDPHVSPMRNYNERMTVQQMVDLATFLQPRYHRVIPPAYMPR